MSGPCRNGTGCARLANLIVRVAGTGDRAMCDPCFRATHELLGDGRCTPTECHERCSVRRLPLGTFVPLWRQRDLAADRTEALA